MLSAKNKPKTTLGISAEQITQIAGNATTYDLRGNLTAYEVNGKDYSLEYDLDNSITKVTVDNDEVEYRYDAFGRRIIRQEGNTKSALIWWGNSECAEHKHRAGTAGEPKRAQAHPVIQNDIMSHPTRLNSVIARAVEGSKFRLSADERERMQANDHHKNYLDHVYAVSDKSGNILEHYRYTAFGEVTIYNDNGQLLNQSAIDNTILWNTRRKDEVSGYYMYKYRHYAPELGRWPSRDPIEEEGGVNLYAFVGNDGINLWDRLGLEPPVVCPIDKKIFFIGRDQVPHPNLNKELREPYDDMVKAAKAAGFEVVENADEAIVDKAWKSKKYFHVVYYNHGAKNGDLGFTYPKFGLIAQNYKPIHKIFHPTLHDKK